MSLKINLKLSEKKKKVAKISAIVLAVSILALAAAFSAYAYDYRAKTLPQIIWTGHELSGKTREQLESIVYETSQSGKTQMIKLVESDKSWEIEFKDLGWDIDSKKLTGEIFDFGHSEHWYKRILPLLRQVFISKKIPAGYTFDENKAEDWLNSINSEIGTPKVEGNLQIKGGDATVIEPKSGKKIDDLSLKRRILDRFELKLKGDIKIGLITDEPTVSADEARALETQAKELVKDEIELVGPKGSTKVSSDTLGGYIEIKKESTEKRTFLNYERRLGPAYVSFSKDKFKTLLQYESDSLNTLPSDAKFSISAGKVSIYQASQTGKVIKLNEAVELIVRALEQNGTKKITLPYETKEPTVSAQTSADIEKYGIKELIGTATTDFSRSPANRIANIKTGVSYISGALVKPGEQFSTLAKLGSIDRSSGYLPELVIKENATVPEYGGGLCQVSTTLFRAAMNSGLEITARQNHSYRVPYYEPPVGMDATIYSPRPDFKFLNDTSAYILVQGAVSGNRITFEFYGTKDGRSVSISDPYVYDVTAPPETIYIEDSTLQSGEEVRVDRAHSGAKASFNYKVTKNGREIINQTFVSSYVPWAAKYRRGPQKQEEKPPEATPTPTPSPSPSPSPKTTASR